jgi:hypothetical protein
MTTPPLSIDGWQTTGRTYDQDVTEVLDIVREDTKVHVGPLARVLPFPEPARIDQWNEIFSPVPARRPRRQFTRSAVINGILFGYALGLATLLVFI